MDLQAATEQVYAATPEDFMSVRTELVAEARQAKDRELAKAIAALRKPTRSAWLINMLARSAAAEVADLLDLGEALREAQASLSGPELRRLSDERKQAVRALAVRAGSLAAEHDHRVTDGQIQEVTQHLQAALADPALAEDVRHGRVTQIVTVGGFGPWDAGAAAVGPISPAAGAAAPAKTRSAAAEDAAVSAASPEQATTGPSEAEVHAAREDWEQTQAVHREAEAEVATAEEAVEAVTHEAERLRTELAAAEQAVVDANVRRRAAEEHLTEVRNQADEASRRLEELLD